MGNYYYKKKLWETIKKNEYFSIKNEKYEGKYLTMHESYLFSGKEKNKKIKENMTSTIFV